MDLSQFPNMGYLELRGTWLDKGSLESQYDAYFNDTVRKLIIDIQPKGWVKIYDVFEIDGNISVYEDTVSLSFYDVPTYKDVKFEYNDSNFNNITRTGRYPSIVRGSEEIYKFSSSIEVPSEYQKSEPRIGMTKEEVRESTWGEPIEINKTVTVYGTSEQWVYNNYKYIYFDDNIVTGIQE